MSIVAMKKKMEAKRGLSTGGKGFSINPKVKCSDVNSTTTFYLCSGYNIF